MMDHFLIVLSIILLMIKKKENKWKLCVLFVKLDGHSERRPKRLIDAWDVEKAR